MRTGSGGSAPETADIGAQQGSSILARYLLRAQEEERSRIAVGLHDGINQEVAMLSLELGTAISGVGDDQLRERLIAIRNRAIRLSEEVRRISHGLRPALLEYIGFAGAVRSHCRDLSENAGLRVDLAADDSLDLPADVATVLYRIVQEALQNVVRHARATAVTVQIQERNGFIALSVEDNGVGFSRGSLPPGSGMGLASMRERARSLGGELTVRKAAPHGTRMEALIPSGGVK
ncbi:MAG: sensor histidine kinase [Candidatus Solibacter sp.]|nr:sensor histidine kinase [Candidatus Solibacter sp.]